MNILHCTKCHHEWCGADTGTCDWCGAPGRVIGQTNWPTPEQFQEIVRWMLERQKEYEAKERE